MLGKGETNWILDDITRFPQYFLQITFARSETKKEEIWLSPITKAPTPTENISKDDTFILNLLIFFLVSANTSVQL